MRFAKLHGTGNDFVVIDAREVDRNWAALARVVCNRHLGVGADGLILVMPSNKAHLRMRMFNPDGSEAETCGNGLRCFAKYVVDRGIIGTPHFDIETLAGVSRAEALVEDGRVVLVRVRMATPVFAPDVIPVELSSGRRDVPVVDYPLRIGRHKLLLTFVSMGNPHAVAFTRTPVALFPLSVVGPLVEHHPMFPRRMNFEIVRMLERGRAEARVWERGAGETMACGSGACALAVAAKLHGYVDYTVDIILPGGRLAVTWDGRGEVYLAGPVAEVFTGDLSE